MAAITIDWPLDVVATLVESQVQEFATEFIQDINNELVFDTPVITGHLRGSWFAALNTIPGSAGSPGRDSASEMNAIAATFTLGDTYYAVNTAVYAARVEYGFVGRDKLGRNYNQAGRGWVRAVGNRAQQIAEVVAERIRGRK